MPRSPGTWLIVVGILLPAPDIQILRAIAGPGRPPGDIRIERNNVLFYLPIVTMIVVSVVISRLFHLFGRFWK